VDYADSSTTRAHRQAHRTRVGKNIALAWCCFTLRHSYDVIMTDGEQVGLPYAAFTMVSGRRRARHLMIVHILSVPKKAVLFRLLRLRRRIDEMIVYSSAQRDFAIESLRMPSPRVTLVPFMVDTEFFAPGSAAGADPVRLVCSAGLEFRDYPTLVEAVRGLDVRVVLAAASPWSKRKSELASVDLPPNVEVVRLDLHQLRELYARASLVVMPLQEVDFQAGVTTLLESMAMAKPIICTRTTGQTDVITDGVTGRYVPSAMSLLCGHAARAARRTGCRCRPAAAAPWWSTRRHPCVRGTASGARCPSPGRGGGVSRTVGRLTAAEWPARTPAS
jgi:glycosyltransferase involved in cell wall biosynthesis